jgi:uncharacterized protein YciI
VDKELFWVVFRPCRPDFHSTMTEEEQRVLVGHLESLAALEEQKKLPFAGRAADRSYGVAVFEVSGIEELRAILAENPACRAGVLTAEIQEYRGPRDG